MQNEVVHQRSPVLHTHGNDRAKKGYADLSLYTCCCKAPAYGKRHSLEFILHAYVQHPLKHLGWRDHEMSSFSHMDQAMGELVVLMPLVQLFHEAEHVRAFCVALSICNTTTFVARLDLLQHGALLVKL